MQEHGTLIRIILWRDELEVQVSNDRAAVCRYSLKIDHKVLVQDLLATCSGNSKPTMAVSECVYPYEITRGQVIIE